MSDSFVPCTLRQLPDEELVAAARTAVEYNPANAPAHAAIRFLAGLLTSDKEDAPEEARVLDPGYIAVLATKYWGAGGVDLGVSFMDTQDSSLKNKLLSYMNKWGQYGNIKFREASAGNAQVRIARQRNDGYWSYLGTDVLHIPKDQPTMNLDSFSLSTPESEYDRVVCHETGHTLGFPHEHMRREIVGLLDAQRTIDYFLRFQGWSAEETRQQVLTPLEDAAIPMRTGADTVSIMCYQLPAEITTNGQPIRGGTVIDPTDGGFAAKIYPKQGGPPPPPPPGPPPSVNVREIVDQMFADLEAHARRAAVRAALATAQALADRWLTDHGY